MSTSRPPPPDAELVERMERGEDAAGADESAARAPYQRLIERIGDLDVVEPPPGWVDRAVDRWERSSAAPRPRPRRRWAAWGGVAAAVTAAALIVIVPRCRDTGEPDRFAVVVARGGTVRAGNRAALGDQLRIHAPLRAGAAVEVRVYRDQILVARCPGHAQCVPTARAIELPFTVDVPGTYQVIAFTSAAPLPAPGTAGLERDVLEARKADPRIRIERGPLIDAR